MNYTIVYAKAALKYLRDIPAKVAERIHEKVSELAKNPYGDNNNATKLQGREGYRLRVGDYRVIYEIRADELVIMVLEINPRGGAYKH